MEDYKKFLQLVEKIRAEEIEATVNGKRQKKQAQRIRVMLNQVKKTITYAKRDLMEKKDSEKPLFVEEEKKQKSLFPEYDYPKYVLGGVA